MSNNVTRKGLAFGALVALVSTAIAGAPAQAAGELNVVPSAGTSYNALSGTVFNLKTTFAPGFTPSSYAQLKYQIKTDANSAVTYGLGVAAVTAPATSVAVSTTAVSGATGSASATSVNYIGLTNTTTTVTSSVEVTAFVDANNDNALSAGEWNTVRTVTFKKVADVTPVVTVAAPATGDTTATATVSWGDLNVEQINASGAYGVTTGTTNSSLGLEIKSSRTQTTYAAATYSSSTGKFTRTVAALQSGDVITAQAVYATNTFSSSDTYSSVALGTAATGTASARTIATVSSAVVAGNDAKVGSPATSVATAGATENQTTAATGDVRKAGTWTAAATLKDGATTPAAVAGVAVTATVKTSATLSGTAGSVKSIAVGGTTYTSNTANAVFATVTVNTDANGVASVPVTTVGLAANDTVTVTFSAQNLTSLVTVTAKDVVYTVTESNTATTRATLKNTAVSVEYTVKDQFGVVSAATNQRMKISATNSTTTSAAPQFVNVSAGKASATITPVTDSTTAMVITAALEESTLNAGTGVTSWAGPAGANNAADITVNVSGSAFDFTTAPALAGVNGSAYSSSSPTKQTITQLGATDLAATSGATSTVGLTSTGSTTWAAITLQSNTAGAVAKVDFAGGYISTGAAVAGAADTATFYTTGASQVVFVAANTVGSKTVTVTIGSVSKTVAVEFASASSAEGTATTFAVAVAAAAQAGRSIDATVTVTDKWGNPVAGFDATASVAGVASVNGGFSANVTTDANGKATVKLTAGINDLGDAVITFSDNDSATGSTNQLANVTAVAKTVTFGQTDGYIDVLNGKRASVTWSMAKGKRVAFLLNGVRKYNFVQTGDAELNLQFNLKKGTHNIKLIIGGVIVDDITVKITK